MRPRIYYEYVDHVKHSWMELSDEEQEILFHHPRVLDIVPFHEALKYNDDLVFTSHLYPLLEQHDNLSISQIERILQRDDLTTDFISRLLDPVTLMNIRSARMVHPNQLIELGETVEISTKLLSTCRYLNLNRLHEYIDEDDDELASRDDILNGLVDYSRIWINPRLDYELIMELLHQGKITYSDLEDNWLDYMGAWDRSSDIVKFKHTFPDLVDDETYNEAMEEIRASSLESILRFNDPITKAFNNHDACELIEPYYFREEDILSHDELSMYVTGKRLHRVMGGLPARFKVLLSLGHLSCVRNCFKPMAFSDRSLMKYSDIEIITV